MITLFMSLIGWIPLLNGFGGHTSSDLKVRLLESVSISRDIVTGSYNFSLSDVIIVKYLFVEAENSQKSSLNPGDHKKQKIIKKYSRSSENEPLEIHDRRL